MKPATSNSATPIEEKVGVAMGYRGTPLKTGFPFNISATAEASDFKFYKQLGFAMAHHEITPSGKSGVALG